jgi:hypothetical protein
LRRVPRRKTGHVVFQQADRLLRDRIFEYWLQERKKRPDQFDYFFSFIASAASHIREWFNRDMRETPEQMAHLTERARSLRMGAIRRITPAEKVLPVKYPGFSPFTLCAYALFNRKGIKAI